MHSLLLTALLASPALAQTEAAPPPEPGQKVAIFAAGCFWCMEGPFDAQDGVLSTTSGYIGGMTEHPTYEQVSSGRTGHVEAIRIVYDPSKVTYDTLLDIYWKNVDPTQDGGQFCDQGSQYESAIFPTDAVQHAAADKSREEVSRRFGDAIFTKVIPAGTFWVAEDYHQDYYLKNPARYAIYKQACQREEQLDRVWGEDRK